MIKNLPPEQGQLAVVRQRRFVVTEVRRSELPPERLQIRDVEPQNLVTLSSVEEDALGEELQVIWELEPGARAYEKMALPAPTGFDDPQRLDAFLDAVRWGTASIADIRMLLAPFRSGIDIEDYQLDPVVRAIQMPRVSLLVADDVGLGKTIEAGLVVQELLLRHRARQVLVVCPSSIQIQWRDQMRDKFGLEFRIVDSALMRELRRSRGLHANPWSHFPRLITSIDFLKRERPLRLFQELLPGEGEATYPRRFDLLIVDEAHNVAPSGRGRYAIDSQRTAAIRLLVPHFEHRLFLTATPHNGYKESFTALLELLDNQRFARDVEPDHNQLDVVMVRRLKREITDWDGTPRFPQRVLKPLEVPYTEAERNAHQCLKGYTRSRRDGARDEREKFATDFVLKLLKKRLFSSPQAFATTLAKHRESLQAARRAGSSLVNRPSIGILRQQLEDRLDEEFADDQLFEESTTDTIDQASRLFREPTASEQSLLQQLEAWGNQASTRPDTKAAALLQWLQDNVRPGGQWSDRRVLIFTEYRTTQKWLMDLLAAEGFTRDDRLMLLYGGMPVEDRERIKAAFQAHPDISPVRILLATDAASEGIDLQNHCAHLIHYEIPWNPNRMEQRNGRIDRHGQRASEVQIFHFVAQGYQRSGSGPGLPAGDLEGDLEFLMRAAIKVDAIREDLGKVGPVIAQQVEEAMLGKRTWLQTEDAERKAEPIRRMFKFERKVHEQIARLKQQLDDTRQELHLSPENIQRVVDIGLELAGQPPLIETKIPGLWPDPAGRKERCPVFHLPALKGSWALCTQGLAHPHTREIRPIVFDPDLAKHRDDVVLAHLNHRLVQMCLRLLRAEVWSFDERKNLHRVTARLVGDAGLDNPVVIAHGRLLILGTDGQRLHEEIITAGGVLREGRFARLNVGQVQNALDHALPDPAPEAIKQRLSELWPTHRDGLLQSLEVRMRERTESLQKLLQERADKETANISAVLQELKASIEAELQKIRHQPEYVQLSLFTTPEKEQFERDVAGLEARLQEIPGEIEQEVAAIRHRFQDPSPRLFPAAVTYLVPRKLTH